MTINKTDYLALITSQYQSSTKFLSWLESLFGCIQDSASLLESMDLKFDLDYAIGAQLDIVGEIVGLNRKINIIIYESDVGFTWDDANLGWDTGIWTEGNNEAIYELDDDTYRSALRVKIVSNMWDGSIPVAYECFNNLFGSTMTVAIQNNLNMTMDLIFYSSGSLLYLAYLFLGEYITFRPAGVGCTYHLNDTGHDYFAWDIEEGMFAGWDEGYWSDGGYLVPFGTGTEYLEMESGFPIHTESGESIEIE